MCLLLHEVMLNNKAYYRMNKLLYRLLYIAIVEVVEGFINIADIQIFYLVPILCSHFLQCCFDHINTTIYIYILWILLL